MNSNFIKLFISVCLCVLAFLIPFLSYYGVLIPEDVTINNWFESSGALMVSFGVIAEFIVAPYSYSTRLPQMLFGQDRNYKEFMNKWGKFCSIIEIMSLLIIFVGTLIWGYSKYMLA